MGKLTATLPDDLHQRIRQALEESGMTTSQFLNEAIQYFFNRDQKEDTNMAMRTLAFQIDEETFQRLKQYFRDYREMYGRNITQKEFCLGVILEALEEGEQEVREWREAQQREREKAYGEDEYEQEGPEEAPVSAEYDEGDPQPDESEQAATEDFSDDMEQEENVEGVSEDQSESEAAEFDEGAAEVAVEEQAESEAADLTEDTAEELSEGDQQPDEGEQAVTEDFPDDLKQEEASWRFPRTRAKAKPSNSTRVPPRSPPMNRPRAKPPNSPRIPPWN